MCKEDIILFKEAAELEKLGFDEPCIAWHVSETYGLEIGEVVKEDLVNDAVLAPTYASAFEFLEKRFGLFRVIDVDQTMEPKFTYLILRYFKDENGLFEWIGIYGSYLYYTRREAELDCLKEMIILAKNVG
jgi:hypothetical protein